MSEERIAEYRQKSLQVACRQYEPTPAGAWHAVGPFIQDGATGDALATTYQQFTNSRGTFDRLPERARANARYIARACNAHSQLVSACERVLRAIEWSESRDRLTAEEQADILRNAIETASA